MRAGFSSDFEGFRPEQEQTTTTTPTASSGTPRSTPSLEPAEECGEPAEDDWLGAEIRKPSQTRYLQECVTISVRIVRTPFGDWTVLFSCFYVFFLDFKSVEL